MHAVAGSQRGRRRPRPRRRRRRRRTDRQRREARDREGLDRPDAVHLTQLVIGPRASRCGKADLAEKGGAFRRDPGGGSSPLGGCPHPPESLRRCPLPAGRCLPACLRALSDVLLAAISSGFVCAWQPPPLAAIAAASAGRQLLLSFLSSASAFCRKSWGTVLV